MQINVKNIAKLANLPIKKDEEEKFENQLQSTLDYITRLNSIDTSKIAETNEVTNLENVFREDEPQPSLSQDKALENASRKYNGFFVVKAIME